MKRNYLILYLSLLSLDNYLNMHERVPVLFSFDLK